MGIRLPSVLTSAKHHLTRNHSDVPKGHLAVYVGDMEKKKYMVPISYLNHPSFQGLLHQVAEEFCFHHPTGGLTISCEEDAFINLTSILRV